MFREFFYMHKSDRRVILALLAVGAVALTVVFVAGGREETPVLSVAVDSIAPSSSLTPSPPSSPTYYAQPTVAPARFRFDPNTADCTAFLPLGLQPWQVRNIYKYRAAGGLYRKK